MNTQTIEKNWTELKGRIKSKWSKFNDLDMENIKGDFNGLADKVQKAYGIAKDQADHQCDEFKKSVQSLLGQEAAAEPAKVSPIVTPNPVPAAKIN